jgi:hypothetical protein
MTQEERLREAFVKGAKWWEFESTGGTMWQSDQHKAHEEAALRYPDPLAPAPAEELIPVKTPDGLRLSFDGEILGAPAPKPPEKRFVCQNCGAEVPELHRTTMGQSVCCIHCVFNPLGCRCKYGELGVAETGSGMVEEGEGGRG